MGEIVPLDERFTKAAAAAWTSAEHHAERLGHDWLGTEHVLLGILAAPDDPAARLLVAHGASAPRISARVHRLGGGRPKDAALLASLGIDLAAVREHVTSTFGADAVNRLYQRRRGWARRTPAWGPLCGRRFMPRLERAVRSAIDAASRSGRSRVDTSDLLRGLLAVDDSLAVELLRADGVDMVGLQAGLQPSARRR
jgi:ATP-dependent Clp protease ATP-binding subunit ClpA